MKKIPPVLILVIALVLIGGGLYWMIQSIRATEEGILVEAEVVDLVEEDRPGRSDRSYYPVLEYRTMDGDLKRTQLSVSKVRNGQSEYQVGDRVSIYYDRDDPSEIVFASFFDRFVPGGIAILLGLALLIGSRIKERSS